MFYQFIFISNYALVGWTTKSRLFFSTIFLF